ncbi:hypothetical protein Syun_009653 [Stephania yunnanensis]|uniref:Uncharacterized protein n=1 Tax=Stephania yunnanensis TaxID=152371 RepID=A0AAP0PQV5_9MAGN
MRILDLRIYTGVCLVVHTMILENVQNCEKHLYLIKVNFIYFEPELGVEIGIQTFEDMIWSDFGVFGLWQDQ